MRTRALLVLSLLAACSRGAPPTDAAAGGAGLSADAGASVATETVVADMLTAVPPDRYTLEAASVRGDSLHATVQYGGGCRTHEFRLVLVRGFMESDPVQLRALLDHRANGDACKALLTRELRFDLRPLRALWRDAYHRDAGTVVLNLLPPASRSVTYRF